MRDVDINTLTLEQYMALTRGNNGPDVVRPEIRNNADFEIKSQFMKELRLNLYASIEDEDAYEHVQGGGSYKMEEYASCRCQSKDHSTNDPCCQEDAKVP
nr:hypothetical protein [Tanacetum cinerariifolium]